MQIIIKFGELTLKKGHRAMFLHQLYENIKKALQEFNLTIIKYFDYILVNNVTKENQDPICHILSLLPGISKFYFLLIFDAKLSVPELATQIINTNDNLNKQIKFRVSVKRVNKQYSILSMDFAKMLASCILKQKNNLQVDLTNYDEEVYVEIHKDGFFVLSHPYAGIGGLPVSKENKTLCLISGGIDSPVAAKLMLKKGFHLDFITFISPPYTSKEAKQKTIKLAKLITLNNKLCNSKLYIVNFTQLQNEISHISNQSYKINLMRRSFFRIASHLCKYLKIWSITTGESLGQVASQTFYSMQTISNVLNPLLLIFRPLLCFDKLEIIKLATFYQTYPISIEPYPDSCSLFAPENPVTEPNVATALALEAEIPLLTGLEENASLKENIEVINLCE